MAYVPQFIPTNTQALQGTLNQYQQSYDAETARMNQVADTYSALPTTNPYDTTEKNRLMGSFQKDVIEGLDKKYNYDRANTQYAKDLAREIGKLRGNPLWSLVNERSKVDEQRRALRGQMGSDYFEGKSPDEMQSIEELKQWLPLNKKVLRDTIGKIALEHATARTKPIYKEYPQAGIVEVGTQYGYADDREMEQFLADNKGEDWLKKSMQGTGFEGFMDNPEVVNTALNAARANLIGKRVTSTRAIPKDLRGDGSNGEYPINLTNVGAGREVKTYGIKSLEEEAKIRTGDTSSTLDKETVVGTVLSANPLTRKIGEDKLATSGLNRAERENINSISPERQRELDRVDAVRNEIESVNSVNMETGRGLVRTKLEQDPKFLKLPESQKQVVLELAFTNLKNSYPAFNSSSNVEIDSNTGEVVETKPSLFRRGLKNFLKTNPVTALSYAQINKATKGKVDEILVGVGSLADEKEFRNWYEGNGKYTASGYYPIKKQIEEKLSAGESVDTAIAVVDPITKPTDYNNVKQFIFDASNQLIGKNAGDIEKVQTWLGDPEGVKPIIQFEMNPEGSSMIKIIKGSEVIDLTERPGVSGQGVFDKLADLSGDERFRSYETADINIPSNRAYSINDKVLLGEVIKVTGMNEEDVKDRLEGLTVQSKKTKAGGNTYSQVYEIKMPKYQDELDNLPWVKDGITTKREAFAVIKMLANYKNKDIAETNELMSKLSNSKPVNLKGIKGVDDFVSAIAMQESGGDSTVINPHSGAIGTYQFMPRTLKYLGYNIDEEGALDEFRNDPELQTEYMYKLMEDNARLINSQGYKIDLDNLTDEAKVLLAAAHYGGHTKAKAIAKKDPSIYQSQPARDGKGNILRGKDGKPVKYYPSVYDYMKQSTGIDINNLDFSTLKV